MKEITKMSNIFTTWEKRFEKQSNLVWVLSGKQIQLENKSKQFYYEKTEISFQRESGK